MKKVMLGVLVTILLQVMILGTVGWAREFDKWPSIRFADNGIEETTGYPRYWLTIYVGGLEFVYDVIPAYNWQLRHHMED